MATIPEGRDDKRGGYATLPGMKLVKAMAMVAGTTGISRIVGFIRDMMTAYFLGAGPVADAFVVALKLPNFFRNVTAEGAFSVSFVPIYSQTLAEKGEGAAGKFAGESLSVMMFYLFAFTAVMMAAMPWVLYAIAPGFDAGTERYDLAVHLTRVTFPYLMLMSVASLMGGMLNAHEKFGPFAAASIFFNLCQIGVMVFARDLFPTVGHALAWAVTGSGFVQIAWLLWHLKRHKIRLPIVRPSLTPEVRRLFRTMGPGVLAAGIVHVNLFADITIASLFGTGIISGLYYADRLFQLPLGVVGIAVGTALLPMLTKAFTTGKAEEARDLFNRSLEYCLFLTVPAALAMAVLNEELVATLFQHGAFTPEDGRVTVKALACLSMGLPAYVGIKVFLSAYWARHDTVTPAKISAMMALANIAVALGLTFIIGPVGIALATAISGWVQCFILWRGLRDDPAIGFDVRLKYVVPRIFACSAIMSVVLWVMTYFMAGLFDGHAVKQVFALGVLVVAGAAVYFAAAQATGTMRLGDILVYLKRAPKADAASITRETIEDSESS
ncbi:MAG: putative peptidoglycan lipid flippase MurJ [Micavibrio sp.]|nr:putative peptidoglycan lipid flippase MurJ [Micavibrio sp.]